MVVMTCDMCVTYAYLDLTLANRIRLAAGANHEEAILLQSLQKGLSSPPHAACRRF